MDKTFALVLCSVLLLTAEIQGRCLCTTKGSDFVHPKSLQKLDMYPKSPSCEYIEIIATLKGSGQQKCLNPDSKLVKKMVQNLIKKRFLAKLPSKWAILQ
ncbi:C-X-C motif chemokine 10 isoform X1 [Alligator mississippiensis]|uniref:C-X-C motif chemokine 10 n=2 Tax=Alligator TaxID=8495 RepID=A0A151MMY7_ALLMI|nr:C-X-C motif chemokine 10-like [Alligator sinensis]XP_006270880.1 C-X-C motif chemokine 10 isoform X1 [Alligator mississippiensis]KYO25907.1 C-X-C motif chemokine 10 precursor [Alligator mississippiensis]